ncbi:DEAD/DEAH box helicase [Streptomyces anulatus]|uniref:DEAD/DEAH box helicase n=1 Tax=Streptomyces anulatus TaxID=1892 RepID=UPI00386665CA
MERTLNLTTLREALGPPQPDALPSPEELIRLIAEIEVGAIMSRFTIDDTVLSTAWYLHGVCALSEAAELYTPARRQRAFAVSAHIFDLALADAERPPGDLLSLAFAAQIGYRRAGQDPNATAVFRRVSHLCHGSGPLGTPGLQDAPSVTVRDFIETLALEAGVAFLGLQTTTLRILVRYWQDQLSGLADDLQEPDLRGTLFGPAQAVVKAVAAMANYLTYGARNRLARAQEFLTSVLTGDAGLGDLNARWVAAHLLDLIDELVEGSLHTLLPPDTPRAVAQAFTLTSPPVLTLWPPQRELLTRPTANPLDPATDRLLVSVPTSAGKSLVSQLIMCTHLATVPGRVIYVSPLRSLSREMRRSLRDRLRVLDRELGADTPDFPLWGSPLTDEDDEADIDVVTPERLMHTLRHDPENALSDVTLIVIDEAHHIAQDQRGFLLEGLLAFCQTHPSTPRLVLLSAAVGNGAALAHWLDPNEPEVLFTSAWRGPRRLHGLLTTNALWDQKTTVPRRSKARPWTTRVPMSVRISIRPAQAARIAELTTSHDEPLGELVFGQRDPRDWSNKDSTSTPAYKMFAGAATYLLPAGPMLVVTSTHQLAQNTARAMADHLPEHEPAQELAEQLSAQLGEEHPLIACTRRGIAFHHAALPTDVLEAIEDALRNDRILGVVSTTTLTDGVNLPVRTVVITATLSDDQRAQATGVPGLDAAKLLNAVGRAGRAGRESEGWILLALNRKIDASDHDLFTPADEELQVMSALTREQALRDLAEAEELIAQSADDVMAVTQSLASDFISYVWFVLDANEHLAGDQPLLAVDRLLGMQQLPAETRARWQHLAQQTQLRYSTTPANTRRRWTTTGTSLRSSRTLDHIALKLAERVLQDVDPDSVSAWDIIEPDVLTLTETLQLLDNERAFDLLLQLPERRQAWTFYDRRANRNRVRLDVNLQEAMHSWINGTTIPALARQWLPDAPVDWALEQAVANISKTFEHYLSWTLGALIHLTNDHLTTVAAPVRLRPDTAWCLRFGVDTEQALHLLTSGIHSRTLAHAIGRQAAADGISSTELRQWLADQHIAMWRTLYKASDLEIDDLIEYVRTRRRSLLRAILKDGSVELQVDPHSSVWSTTVSLRWPESGPPSAIRVVDDQGTVSATVRAGDHADLVAVLRSGLSLSLTLQGSHLLLTNRAGAE